MAELWNRIKRFVPRNIWLPLLPVLFLVIVAALAAALPTPESPPEESEEPSPSISSPEPEPVRLVTAEQAALLSYTDSALGELHWSLSEDSLAELNQVLLDYGITTPEEISHFLAQATVETAAGLALTESGSEEYFQDHGYTSGTRGAGYFHLTHDYGQMAFSTWLMKKYVPQLAGIEYLNPASNDVAQISAAYYRALQAAANLGVDVSRYSRVVYNPDSAVLTGADYIAHTFAWESAAYYWEISGIPQLLDSGAGPESVDLVSERVGGSNWQSRREAFAAFYPVLSGELDSSSN